MLLALFYNCLATETFTFTWQSNSNEQKMVWVSATEGQEFIVNWGDESAPETLIGGGSGIAYLITLQHTYEAQGTYSVVLTGKTEDCHFTDFDSYQSGLTSFNAANLSQLTYVSVSLSPVENFNVNGCTALKELYAMQTNLKEIDLSGLKNLESVIVYTDPMNGTGTLETLNLNGCTALTTVQAQNNSIKKLDISGCTSLKTLQCDMNQLTELDASGLTALNDLRCNNNKIKSLHVDDCSELRQLWCYKNNIADLNLSGLTNLQRVETQDNSIETLEAEGCTALQSLDCSTNQLHSLNLNGCSSLGMLSCYSNNLETLDVSHCTSLTELRCYNNNLSNINFGNINSLLILHCFNNKLEKLDLNNLTSLESIDCNTNYLAHLDISAQDKLMEIRCYNNRLPLSDLYATMLKNTILPDYRQLGTQNLPIKATHIGGMADFSADNELGGVKTVFNIEKDGNTAAAGTDYSITDGIITFYNAGKYTITMTNDAIKSFQDHPAIVVATYTVDGTGTGITKTEHGGISLYPRITNGIMTLNNGGHEIKRIDVFDATGRKIKAIGKPSDTIDITDLPSGVYLLRMAGHTFRVVKR